MNTNKGKPMKKLYMTVKLEYDDELIHHGDEDLEARSWFFKDILMEDFHILHNNHIGDEIGTVNVMKIRENPEEL